MISIHYTYNRHHYTALTYSRYCNDHVTISLRFHDFLTLDGVRHILNTVLGNNVPDDTIEAILAYPRDNMLDKDVTVVFTY